MKSEIKIDGNRLQITRVFDAPRLLVFSFWTKAEKLQQWSGCKDATQCQIEMDFRVGGSFTQKMQITGAGEFSLNGTYDEIVEPERIVYHANLGPATTRVVVEFFEQGNGTKMVLTQDGFPSEFLCKTVSQGTSESFDKLDALVAAQALV
ncbi:MAG TPA: SRPBCC domain-containing protein [Bryobacteraceae bacterium]|nr:SRPBCC domain-containing protein [Bryobacteraceae bacterium]